jgi:AAA15 family ATPase/GTPase
VVLCQFTFKNFKSFKDEATLDMQAAKISEHEDSLIVDQTDGAEFLPVAVIYGPNGGGKSSVLEAFVYLARKILSPIITIKEMPVNEEDDDIFKGVSIEKRKIKEFLSLGIDETERYYKFARNTHIEPSQFEIFFRTNGKEYKYQLFLLKNEVVEENLFIKDIKTNDPKIVFERDKDGIYLGEGLESVDVDNIKSSIPLLSYISITKNIEIIDNVINWFINSVVLNYDNPFQDRTVILNKGKKGEKQFLDILNEMDINIIGIRPVKDTDGKITKIFIKHKLHDGSEGELSFEEESSGTRKLFGLLPFVLQCIKSGNLVIADEMDAKLHPKLLRYIVELFTNPKINKKGAQLLFTSHDLTTMKSTIFRRDEIWFAALNQHEVSNLYSLVEFKKENGEKVRKDETFDKQYIEGRYGADPYFRTILDWENLK